MSEHGLDPIAGKEKSNGNAEEMWMSHQASRSQGGAREAAHPQKASQVLAFS